MIDYNYNFACIATAEEMDAVYDSEEGYYAVYNDPKLLERFFEIPQLAAKGIIPYVLTKIGDEDSFYVNILFVLTAHASFEAEAGRWESNINFTGGWVFDEGVLFAD